jgi:Trk K+ transport system NAD-binding subunit
MATIAGVAELWRDRARRVVETRLRDGLRTNGDVNRPHYLVCGQDALVFHLVNELLAADPQMRVTVIVPLRRRPDGPDVRALRGVRVLKADRLDEETFRAAGAVGAAGLALLHQDDVGNIHAALCAQAVAPDVRLVIRMFNTELGNGVQRLFADCAVLSDASMAAPAFVAAALGEVAPTYFRLGGRTFYVARRSEIRPEHLVCGLADTSDPNRPLLLPADQATADLVLAEATGQQPGTERAARRLVRARRRRQPIRTLGRAARSFATRKIGIATLVVLAVVLLFGFLLAPTEHNNLWHSIYVTLITTVSGADPEPEKSPVAQLMQVVLTLAGLALIPLITAAVVDGMVNARLALESGRLQVDREGHVVVVGLGNVGTRVMGQLTDLGIEVVAIDKDPAARGARLANRLNVPMIVGDAAREEILAAASVGTCQALVVVSTDDVTNLQAALNGRAAKPDLRVVLRLFDGDFAERIQQAFNIDISRSVSYLAAPSFAAALLHRAVIATIPVGRHALLVAEVPVAAGSALVGQRLGEISRPEGVEVIGLTRAGQTRVEWSPADRKAVRAGDRLTVVVRRASLGRLLREGSPQPPAAPVSPAPPPAPGQRPVREVGPGQRPNVVRRTRPRPRPEQPDPPPESAPPA